MTIPRILIVAGSDSGGGAGIQADIKTVTMLGGHAMTAITAITAQNSLGVTAVHPVPTAIVLAQIDAVAGDFGVDAVKIGMIGSADTAAVLADRLPQLGVPIVFDPVMVATSGAVLADEATVAAFGRLAAAAALTTPNAPELAVLTGRAVEDGDALAAAAAQLAQASGRPVLAKGGHVAAEMGGVAVVRDLLAMPDGAPARSFSASRIDTRHAHGTGCTLASGIATGLAAGLALDVAIDRARAYVRAALKHAPGLGAGSGPMGHALGLAPFDELRARG